MKNSDRKNLSQRENMKKEERKLLRKFTKPQLLNIIKNQDFDIECLERQYRRALRCIASYRCIIKTEMRSSESYWAHILDDMVDEIDDEATPLEARVPQKKSKKRDVEVSYT